MDLRGYDKICQALTGANITATVEPRPDDEHTEHSFVRIETVWPATFTAVYEALGNAGLMFDPNASYQPNQRDPRLQAMSEIATSVLFQDRSVS